MKTVVSIPDDVFAAADRYAKQTGQSRSQLYSEAIRQYLLARVPARLTEAMNRASERIGADGDGGSLRAASLRRLRREEW